MYGRGGPKGHGNLKLTKNKKPVIFLHLRPILKTPEKEFFGYYENSSEAPGVEKKGIWPKIGQCK